LFDSDSGTRQFRIPDFDCKQWVRAAPSAIGVILGVRATPLFRVGYYSASQILWLDLRKKEKGKGQGIKNGKDREGKADMLHPLLTQTDANAEQQNGGQMSCYATGSKKPGLRLQHINCDILIVYLKMT